MNKKSPYSSQFLQRQKEILLKKLERFSQESLDRSQIDSPDQEIDPVESAALVGQEFNNQAEKGLLDQDIIKIKQALIQLENETYGRCRVCDGWIEQARLEAMPTATEHASH